MRHAVHTAMDDMSKKGATKGRFTTQAQIAAEPRAGQCLY